MKPARLILCLDVAFAHLGVAVWNCRFNKFIHWDVIVTKPIPKKKRLTYQNEDSVRRCQEITRRLDTITAKYHPSLILAELPSGGSQGVKPAVCMAMALALVSTFAEIRGLQLYPVQPMETKRIVSDKGKVPKEKVIQFVEKRFSIKFPKNNLTEHIADAMMTIEVARTRLRDRLIDNE